MPSSLASSTAPPHPPRSDKDVAVLVKRSRRLIREECRLERTNGVAKGGFKEIKVPPAFIRLVNNVRFKGLPRIRNQKAICASQKRRWWNSSRKKGELRRIKRMLGSRRRLMSALMRNPALGATSEDESFGLCRRRRRKAISNEIISRERVATWWARNPSLSPARKMSSTPRGVRLLLMTASANIGLRNH